MALLMTIGERQLVKEIKWCDDFLLAGGMDRGANSTSGNKKSGLTDSIIYLFNPASVM